MNPKYAPLFQTYTLNNGVTIKNRLVVAPMTHFGSQADGLISDQERTFLSNRAGDMGLFITAATLVQKDGKAFHGQPEATGEHCLDSLKETAQILRQQGTKAILQIHHGGSKAIDDLLDGLDKISASTNEAEHAREATAEEVEALIDSYAQAADLALRAGFDGVEIHGANGSVLLCPKQPPQRPMGRQLGKQNALPTGRCRCRGCRPRKTPARRFHYRLPLLP